LPATLADVPAIPAALYGWGTADLDFPALAEVAGELLSGLGLPTSIDRLTDEEGAALQVGATGTPAGPVRRALSVVLFDLPVGGVLQETGFTVTELPAEGTAWPGLIVQPLVPEGIGRTDLGGGWTFEPDAGIDLSEQLAVAVRPDGVSVRHPGVPDSTLPAGGFGISLRYDADEPLLLFGQPGGIRLELAAATLGLSVREVAGDLELTGSLTMEGLTLILSAGDLDGFLASVLGTREARIELTFGVSWSSRTGLDFIEVPGSSSRSTRTRISACSISIASTSCSHSRPGRRPSWPCRPPPRPRGCSVRSATRWTGSASSCR